MKRLAIVSVAALSVLFAQQVTKDASKWSVEGDVISDSGPVQGAEVSASGPERIQPATTDLTGHYILKGHSAGLYELSASHEEGPAKSTSVRVLLTSRLHSIDFKLDKGAVLSGRVRDDDRNPVQEVMVSAWVKIFREGRLYLLEKGYAKTDDLGQYRIPKLSEGTYYVIVTPEILKPRKHATVAANRGGAEQVRLPSPVRVGFYPNAQSFDGAAPVSLHAGKEREGVDIQFAKADSFCVTATIIPPHGGGPIDGEWQLYARVGDSFPTAAIGPVAFGEESEVCGLSRGQYTTVAIAIDRQSKKATAFCRNDFAIGDRDVVLGKLDVVSGIALRGTVGLEGASQESTVPSGLSIELRRRGRPLMYGDNLWTEVQPAGVFLLENVFPDDYGLTVDGLPHGYYVRNAVQQGRDVIGGPVRPGGGELRIVLGSDGATVKGQTVDGNGARISGAAVILIPKDARDGSTDWSQQSDQNGEFEFASGIGPGEYRLLAFTDLREGEDQDPAFIRNHLSSATDVTVRPKEVMSVALRVLSGH